MFRLAHDSDCIPGEQLIGYWRDRKIYEYGIEHADLIVAQGIKQVSLMREHYDLSSVPINMTVEFPGDSANVDRDIDILWVNNFREFKRPELVLKLASLLPEFNISMIGGPAPGNEGLYRMVEAKTKVLNNLSLLGAVPYHDVNDYFSRSRIFVNTSDREGFPNSFLQAWAREVPVVSFFDPDGLISSEKLGTVPEGIEEMAGTIRGLLSNEVDRREMALKARVFVLEKYSPESVANKYESLFHAPPS